MILSCNNISKAFGTDQIIEHASFHIEDREKAAIVGINGAGKSTLIKIIMDIVQPDEGEVVIAKDKTIGYLAQHQDLLGDNTIYGELLTVKQDIIDMENRIRNLETSMKNATGSELENMLNTYSRLNHDFELKNGYAYKSEIIGVLKGLGFSEDDFDKKVSSLSGGQKTRVSLGKLLLSKPDILLLDEPTNHLDLESVSWLETFLLNYPKSVLIVAHDRYFLDRVVTKIIEIENKKVTTYMGNYTEYSQKSKMVRDAKIKEYLNQQKEIRHQEEVIEKLRSFNREKSIKRAESREKLLNKMDVVEKPVEIRQDMSLRLVPHTESGNDVLSVKGLDKAFGNNVLFKDLNFEIKRNEKVALIGNNGTGKTTILKIINGIVDADAGSVKLGAKVSIGYYDQEHNVLTPDNTIFEEISDAYENLTNTEIRNVLASFLFTNDDVFKQIKDLSGGERGRVSLAKLMLSKANFLILDEPTNHLDMVSKEILENALNNYEGTILYVSHDRYFINSTASRIIDLNNGQLINYIGNYDYYLEKRDILTPTAATENEAAPLEAAGKTDWKAMKEEQAKERKKQNRINKIESTIEELENENSLLDKELENEEICKSPSKLMEIHEKKTLIETKINDLMEEWETLLSE